MRANTSAARRARLDEERWATTLDGSRAARFTRKPVVFSNRWMTEVVPLTANVSWRGDGHPWCVWVCINIASQDTRWRTSSESETREEASAIWERASMWISGVIVIEQDWLQAMGWECDG